MKLSAIIPAYNEASTIEEILKRVAAVAGSGVEIEMVVVDDASTDGTREVLRSLDLPGLRVLRHESNQGKGAAIRTGLGAATGEVVIIQDADLEYDPEDYRAILAPMKEHGAPVVYGSRILGRNPHSYLRYYYGGRLLTRVFNVLFRTRLTDLNTCYKAFRREVLASIPLRGDGFEFCTEVTARLVRQGVPIVEVPIAYHPRSLEQGKKIRWTDGLKAVYMMLRLRWP